MRRRIISALILTITILAALGSLHPPAAIKAASTASVYTTPTTEEIFNDTPKGLKLQDFVSIPEYYKNTKTDDDKAFKSSNKLYRVGNSTYTNKADIIQLLQADSTQNSQIGSFWGNVKGTVDNPTYNYFDLTKSQEVSVWVYNGREDSNATDGFAFVLQSDENGEQSISRSDGMPVGGQTLGVWGGGGSDPTTSLTSDYGGIKNSIAIEMDRYLNETAGSSSNKQNNYLDFDTFTSNDFVRDQLKEKHMSMGYPGDPDTYTEAGHYQTGSWLSGHTDHYYYYMGHRGPVQNRVPMAGFEGNEPAATQTKADPQRAWRHVKINYTPPASGSTTAELKFAINDKFADGTIKPINQRDGKTYKVDISKLGTKTSKVRWGFTAATGSPESGKQDVAMIVEKMPAVLDIKKQTTLQDHTKNLESSYDEESQTTDKIITANDGDDLTFNYNLTYTGGITASGDMKTTIALPENVNYAGDADGNIGKITYKSASGTTKVQTINKSEIKQITITVPGASALDPPTTKETTGLEVTVPSLSQIDDTAKIEINGQAQAPESDKLQTISVASAHTSFESDDFLSDTMSPEFKIDNEKLQISTTDSLEQELKSDDNIKFNLQANYLRGSKFDGQDLTAKAAVYDADGKSVNADGLQTVSIAKDQTTGNVSFDYPLSGLNSGETYTFKVTLSDSSLRTSNTLTYTVKVGDQKGLVLTRSGNQDYFLVERDRNLTLSFGIAYDDNSLVDPNKVTQFLQIDDQTPSSVSSGPGDSQTIIGQGFEIDLKKLDYGVHTAKIYANDGQRESNVLEYKFKVIDKGLILEPKEETVNVTNNEPVKLTWNVKYSSEIDNLDGKVAPDFVYRKILQLKTEGDTDFKDIALSSISVNGINIDSDNNLSFTLNPINFDLPTNEDLKVLKEGRNELKFSIQGGDYTSEVKTIVINVPKLKPEIDLSTKEIYFNKLKDFQRFTPDVSYPEDDTYTSKMRRMSTKLVLDDGSEHSLYLQKSDTKDYTVVPLSVGITPSDIGVSADNPKVKTSLVVTDVYNRQAKTDLTFIYSEKLLELTVNNNYRFENIGPNDKIGDHIKRDGKWQVNVNSLGAKWNLNAQSDGLFSQKDTSYYEPLIFMNTNGSEQALSNNPIIASRSTAVTSQNKIENIAGDWNDDEGILLENMMPNLSGEYSGDINWTITEAP